MYYIKLNNYKYNFFFVKIYKMNYYNVDCILFALQGMLGKKGNAPVANWKDRWFILTKTDLRYYTKRDLKEIKGDIKLHPEMKIEVLLF